MRHNFFYSFFILFIVSACAPLHIRQHEAAELENLTGETVSLKNDFDSKQYYSIQSNTIRGSISIYNNSSQKELLDLSIFLIGNKGDVIKVNQNYLKYKYSGNEWKTVECKISSKQLEWVDGASTSAKEYSVSQPAFYKDYIYSMEDKKGNQENFTLTAPIPMEEVDLEVEFPEIYLNGKLLTPRIYKFKWSDRWTLVPING